MSQVNTELARSSTAAISLNDSAVRTLAGLASGAIGMSALRGKSYDVVTWVTASGSLGSPIRGDGFTVGLSATSTAGGVTYSIVAGALPPGLGISGASITGTVSSGATVTTYSFTVRATGAGGAISDRAFSIAVQNLSGTVCGFCYEGGSITLSCPSGTTFQYLVYANYGTPYGCPSPSDNGPSTGGVTDGAQCGSGVHFEGTNIAGATTISFSADNDTWGDPCGGVYKQMAVVAYYA